MSWSDLIKKTLAIAAPVAPKSAYDTPGTPEWNARQDAASAARWNQGALVPTVVTAPKSAAASSSTSSYATSGKTAPKATTSKAASTAKKPASGSGSGGTYTDGYNKAVAEANARKANDAPQVAALQKMIDEGFGAARDIKLANIQQTLDSQDKIMLDDYLNRAGQLEGARADNEKAEHDSSFSNLANRARERGDILMQATSQGAGESDVLRSTLMALRNWSANQGDVNRSYFDTMRSVNSSIVDLNADTRTARANLYNSANSDREQTWTNFYNQRADAWTQMGNIQGNPNSDSYQAGSSAFSNAAAEAGRAWVSEGIPGTVTDWKGSSQAEERYLNNGDLASAQTNGATPKKPEGATLRKW